MAIRIKEERKGRDIEEIEYQRYVFSFDVKGIVDNIEMKVITGTVINDEPPHIIAKGRGVKKEKAVYNRLTTACIGLNLVNEKELSTIKDLVCCYSHEAEKFHNFFHLRTKSYTLAIFLEV